MTGYDLGLMKTASLATNAGNLLSKVKKPAMYLGLGGGGLYLGQKGYEEKVKAANLRAKLRSLQEQSQAPQVALSKEAGAKEFFGAVRGLAGRGAARGAAKVVRPNVRTGIKAIGEIPKVPGTAMVSAHNLHMNPPVPASAAVKRTPVWSYPKNGTPTPSAPTSYWGSSKKIAPPTSQATPVWSYPRKAPLQPPQAAVTPPAAPIRARRAQAPGYQNPQWTPSAAAQREQRIAAQASKGVNTAPKQLPIENAAPPAMRRKFNFKPGFGTGLTAGLGAWGLASTYNRGDARTDPTLQFAQG